MVALRTAFDQTSASHTSVAAIEMDMEQAREICDLIVQIHPDLLRIIRELFAASHDRRVKQGGLCFVAHLLRCGGAEIACVELGGVSYQVIRIRLPRIYQLQENRHETGWQWCHDTTLKYLRLLETAGVLIASAEEHGTYYLPLQGLQMSPEDAYLKVIALSTYRHRVSGSVAFQRAVTHCTQNVMKPAQQQGDEASAAQIALRELHLVLQREQRLSLQTRIDILRIYAQATPKILEEERQNRFVRRNKQSSDFVAGEEQFDLQDPQAGELHPELVQLPAHPRGFEPADYLAWRFGHAHYSSAHNIGTKVGLIAHLGDLISLRYQKDDSRRRYYRGLIEEDARALDLAIINGLIRDVFPDRQPKHGHKFEKLGGGWITQRYQGYRDGSTPLEAVVLAWADTAYSYAEMEKLLSNAARHQKQAGQPLSRPLPDNIVIQQEDLLDFWQQGGPEHYIQQGYLFVELEDSDLVPMRSYALEREEAMRAYNPQEAEVPSGSDGYPVLSTAQAQKEWWLSDLSAFAASRDLLQPLTTEEEAEILADLPPQLLAMKKRLEQYLDAASYVQVRVGHWTRARLLEIRNRSSQDIHLLRNLREAEHYLQWLQIKKDLQAYLAPEEDIQVITNRLTLKPQILVQYRASEDSLLLQDQQEAEDYLQLLWERQEASSSKRFEEEIDEPEDGDPDGDYLEEEACQVEEALNEEEASANHRNFPYELP